MVLLNSTQSRHQKLCTQQAGNNQAGSTINVSKFATHFGGQIIYLRVIKPNSLLLYYTNALSCRFNTSELISDIKNYIQQSICNDGTLVHKSLPNLQPILP